MSLPSTYNNHTQKNKSKKVYFIFKIKKIFRVLIELYHKISQIFKFVASEKRLRSVSLGQRRGTFLLLEANLYQAVTKEAHKLKYPRKMRRQLESISDLLNFELKSSDL